MLKVKFSLLMLCCCLFTLDAQAKDVVIKSADDIKWGLLNPLRGEASPKAADLWGDRTQTGPTGMLVAFKQGFSSPAHIHNVSYRGVVIKGLMHNDDPSAKSMWLTPGAFWTQPAGESHVTAAKGQDNLIYLEIDQGPYRVLSKEQAFDNGERPINVEPTNLVWLDARDSHWLKRQNVQMTFLWGDPNKANGSFLKLPKSFKGKLVSLSSLKAVVVSGEVIHQGVKDEINKSLTPGGYFSSSIHAEHRLYAKEETVIYIHSNNHYTLE